MEVRSYTMPQLGTEQNPIRFNPKGKIKVGGVYLKNENKEKYNDNYDRIFNKTNSKVNSKQLVK
jgi:hypothetical protein